MNPQDKNFPFASIFQLIDLRNDSIIHGIAKGLISILHIWDLMQVVNNVNNTNLINVENSINFDGFGNENVNCPYIEYLSQTKESWAFVNNVYSPQRRLFFSHLPLFTKSLNETTNVNPMHIAMKTSMVPKQTIVHILV